MKLLYALLLAAAGAPLAASAQSDRPAPPPYRSAFAGYQSTPEPTQPPDQAWRQANRDVAAAGHGMGHMNHGAAGHAGMDHGTMDHSKMDHGTAGQDAADHGAMEHSQMHHGMAGHDQMGHGKHKAAGERRDPHGSHGGQQAAPAQPAPAPQQPPHHQHHQHHQEEH